MINKEPYYKLLHNGEVFPCILNALLVDTYGEDMYEWDITTIWLELKDTFDTEVDPDISDKIGAVQLIMLNDSFFKRPDAFYGICNTVISGNPRFDVFDEVTPPECLWAIIEVALMRDFLPLDYNVEGMIRAIFHGRDIPSIVNYAITNEDITSDVIIRKVTDILENPTTGLDQFIVDQVGALIYQLKDFPELTKAVLPKEWI